MLKILEDYINIVDDDVIANILKKARKLHEKRVLNLNSTFIGGGVAEILDSMVPLMNNVGINYGWRVIHGCPEFYDITKKIHNGLQGESVKFSKREKELYLEISERYSSYTHINHDYVIIHDPQPLPMACYNNQNQPWILRIHIDMSEPCESVWKFIKPFIFHYNVVIVSREEYKKKDLPIDQRVISPAIDPLSPKNITLPKKIINKYIKEFNISMDKPIITQVSRMDKWKDPLGVLKIYKKIIEKVDCRLLYCYNLATDDPEGMEIYNNLYEEAKDLIDIGDIILLGKDDKVLVNAVQQISDVVIQKSVKEGFCVLPDTKILVKNGCKEIQNIDIGDEVLTNSGQHEPVEAITRRETDNYYNIQCWKGMNIGITGEHKIFAAKRKYKQNFDKLTWIKAENLEIGDYMAVSIPNSDDLDLIIDLKNYDNKIQYDDEFVYYKYGFSGKRKFSYKDLSNLLNINKGTLERVVKYFKNNTYPKIERHKYIYSKLLELGYETPEVEKVNRFIDIKDIDIQWLCGLYIGNGSNNGKFIEICFNKNKINLAKKAKDILKTKFNKESTISIIENKAILYCSSKILVKFFKQFGSYAKNKHIPKEWLKYGKNLQYILVGLFDTDGSYYRFSATYCSINNVLIWQIWYILLTSKIPAKITENIKQNRGFKSNSTINTIRIGGKEYHRFSNVIVNKIHKPSNDNTKRQSNLCIILDDYILYPIKTIEKVNKKIYVYDLKINKTHNFIANGYLIHNCLAVTEALWKSKPVVASNVGGIPSQILNGETGYLVDPYDYQGFADRIIELLKNKKLAKCFGKRAKEYVRQNFLTTRLMDNYLDLMLELS